MTTRTHVGLRWMVRLDMQSVLEIENSSFEFPWTEREFIRCLRHRDCIGMVAEVNEDVVGYMIYEMCKNTIDLLVFAVHQKYRRSGIGGALINRLISKLVAGKRSSIECAVRDSNLQAQLFLRNVGFFCTRVENDYYEECDDDAYVFEYSVGESG